MPGRGAARRRLDLNGEKIRSIISAPVAITGRALGLALGSRGDTNLARGHHPPP